jgi:flagellar motor switch protein FliM
MESAATPLPPSPEGVLPPPDAQGQLAPGSGSPEAAPAGTGAGSKHKPAAEAVQSFDFRQPTWFTPSELRKLRLWHEEFIRALAERLSMFLRLEVNLKLAKLQTLPYQTFVAGLPQPTFLTLFKMEPLRGICIMEIPPRLGLTLVDRMLGGPAQAANAQRDLSEIETALLEQVVQLALGEWCGKWRRWQDLRPVVLGHETNGRFLQTAARDAVLLALAIEARIGECVESLQLAFPYATIEPLASRLNAGLDTGAGGKEAPALAAVNWNPHLNEVLIPVTAKWQGMEVVVREVARLKVGDVLELPPESAGQIHLDLAGLPKFLGRLGTRDKMWAVEITQVLPRDQAFL